MMTGPTDTGGSRSSTGSDDPGYYEALGRAIRVLRTERGLQRKELAEAAGLSYPYLSEIETGRKRPSSKALFAIAEALGVRPSEVLALGDRYGGRTSPSAQTVVATPTQALPVAPLPPASMAAAGADSAPAAPSPASREALRSLPASPSAPNAGRWRWFERSAASSAPPPAGPASGGGGGEPERQRLLEAVVRAADELSDQDLAALLDLAHRLAR